MLLHAYVCEQLKLLLGRGLAGLFVGLDLVLQFLTGSGEIVAEVQRLNVERVHRLVGAAVLEIAGAELGGFAIVPGQVVLPGCSGKKLQLLAGAGKRRCGGRLEGAPRLGRITRRRCRLGAKLFDQIRFIGRLVRYPFGFMHLGKRLLPPLALEQVDRLFDRLADFRPYRVAGALFLGERRGYRRQTGKSDAAGANGQTRKRCAEETTLPAGRSQ